MSAKGSLVRGVLRVAVACFGRRLVNVSSVALIQYSTTRICEFTIFYDSIKLTKLAL